MSKGWKRIGLAVVAAGLSLALILGSVAPTKADEEKVVKIGIMCCLTGAAASTIAPANFGQFDCIRYVNEQGGIHGIKVEGPWEDFAAVIPRAITAHKRMVEAGIVLEINIFDTATMSTIPRLIRDEIPCIFAAGASSPALLTKPIWVIQSGPEGENCMIEWAQWIKEEQWTQERPLRLGYFHLDAPVQSEGWRNAVPYITELGVEVVGDEKLPMFGAVDTSTEWLRLASKQPDWVLVSLYGATLVTAVKDAARLELREKGINFLADQASLDEETLRIVGKDGEGWYKASVSPSSLMTELPGIKAILEAAKKYRGYDPEYVNILYIRGWMSIAIGIEAIRMAIEKVGFENLNGRAVRDALLTIKDLDLGLGPLITITEAKPYYNDYYFVAHVENGKLKPITDWIKFIRGGHHVVRDGEIHFEWF